jgi:enamine deaminase RidA (YjgF/YER057c/UK114 family)
MNIEHVTPDTLFDSKPYGFSQVVISRGSRMIHIAGQTSQDKDLNIIGEGDFAMQAKTAFENVGLAISAAGAEIKNIVSINVYVVDYKTEYLEMIAKATTDFFGSVPPPASTMVGVTALALPPFLIEIEATAVID